LQRLLLPSPPVPGLALFFVLVTLRSRLGLLTSDLEPLT